VKRVLFRVFWIHAIIILRTLRNTITIRLIGNLPLQFSSSHIFARFYVSRGHGPTGRRIPPVYWPYGPFCPRRQRLMPPCPQSPTAGLSSPPISSLLPRSPPACHFRRSSSPCFAGGHCSSRRCSSGEVRQALQAAPRLARLQAARRVGGRTKAAFARFAACNWCESEASSERLMAKCS
jgi:hypothetical protein